MGRLFQYNRFGNADTANKKDNLARNNSKSKKSQAAAKCPAYSELYPEYVIATTTAADAVTTSSATTTTTSKSVELAIKKYQQWSSKFLTATIAAGGAATATTDAVSQSSVSAASTSTTATTTSYSCSATSGYSSGRLGAENDRARLVGAVRRPKVYDCMKDFLRRKLFQQNATVTAKKQDIGYEDEDEEDEDEATSDYDEVDMLDSSYNAEDEEEEGSTDCSCSCSSSEDDGDDEGVAGSYQAQAAHTSSSPQKSALSLNCWQNSNYTDSTTEAEEEEAAQDEDSDAGISDCCHLISEPSPGKRKSPKNQSPSRRKSKQRFNIRTDELPELLESAWYQPLMTIKATLERLQQATPGSFLVRRKAHHFELCVRDSTKVKRFAVVATGAQDASYKLKGARKQFSSLRALVTHHSVMAEQLPLTLALKREESAAPLASLRCADDFDTFESLHILGILKTLQAKNFELS